MDTKENQQNSSYAKTALLFLSYGGDEVCVNVIDSFRRGCSNVSIDRAAYEDSLRALRGRSPDRRTLESRATDQAPNPAVQGSSRAAGETRRDRHPRGVATPCLGAGRH